MATVEVATVDVVTGELLTAEPPINGISGVATGGVTVLVADTDAEVTVLVTESITGTTVADSEVTVLVTESIIGTTGVDDTIIVTVVGMQVSVEEEEE